MRKVVYNKYTFNVVGEILCGPHGKFLWLQQGNQRPITVQEHEVQKALPEGFINE